MLSKIHDVGMTKFGPIEKRFSKSTPVPDKSTNYFQTFNRNGFQVVSTGGSFEAWRKKVEGSEYLVTDPMGVDVPESLHAPALVTISQPRTEPVTINLTDAYESFELIRARHPLYYAHQVNEGTDKNCTINP